MTHWVFGEVVVELARSRDAKAIHAVHLGVIAESRWFITESTEFTSTPDYKAQQILELSRAANSIFLVARIDDKVVGFLTVQGGVLRRMRHTGKLEIMVAKGHRGRGVGKALMLAVIEWAEQNPAMLKLGLNVFADNARALALYTTLGFREEGRREREYRMPDGSWRGDVLLYLYTGLDL